MLKVEIIMTGASIDTYEISDVKEFHIKDNFIFIYVGKEKEPVIGVNLKFVERYTVVDQKMDK